jgi:hypothetical protein
MYAALHGSLFQSEREITPTILAIYKSNDDAISRIRQSVLESLDFWREYWFIDKTKWDEQNPGWKNSIDEIAANLIRDIVIHGSVGGECVSFHYNYDGNESASMAAYVPRHSDNIETWRIQTITLNDLIDSSEK